MNKLSIFCVTDKEINLLNQDGYSFGWVGKGKTPLNYISCNDKENIFFKEKNYSELTFHYWYWKNIMNLKNKNWIGFCQKRRYWVKKSYENEIIEPDNLKNHLLIEPDNDWENYESIICKPISIQGAKKIKIIKRGWKNIIKKPSIFFKKNKENISLHFDMHHGYKNLENAAELLNDEDRDDFIRFISDESSFNPHIMFISKSDTLNRWFTVLFPWLERCEKKFGFEKLSGYDTTRLYAYLAERYLSFWFKKHTKYKEHPWAFINI